MNRKTFFLFSAALALILAGCKALSTDSGLIIDGKQLTRREVAEGREEMVALFGSDTGATGDFDGSIETETYLGQYFKSLFEEAMMVDDPALYGISSGFIDKLFGDFMELKTRENRAAYLRDVDKYVKWANDLNDSCDRCFAGLRGMVSDFAPGESVDNTQILSAGGTQEERLELWRQAAVDWVAHMDKYKPRVNNKGVFFFPAGAPLEKARTLARDLQERGDDYLDAMETFGEVRSRYEKMCLQLAFERVKSN